MPASSHAREELERAQRPPPSLMRYIWATFALPLAAYVIGAWAHVDALFAIGAWLAWDLALSLPQRPIVLWVERVFD